MENRNSIENYSIAKLLPNYNDLVKYGLQLFILGKIIILDKLNLLFPKYIVDFFVEYTIYLEGSLKYCVENLKESSGFIKEVNNLYSRISELEESVALLEEEKTLMNEKILTLEEEKGFANGQVEGLRKELENMQKFNNKSSLLLQVLSVLNLIFSWWFWWYTRN